ncbi:sulfotransferase domain-containing protein [Flammeovirga kamogawensis]|uniref:Sulfotransferase domain-containing protein n=1 Tax=Flammeovirga kamogawensis TaxID=373891 RepID=A0ABX8GWY0_9BACT|nr:sulfotransferase domain-containing protein [Flammeovirga kamogawensis]MBB6460756.1 hypothetical protein [Flammeovirga kamogawensis]QWG08109.1 sulfotransferase domain-containing protein [Flammeovirga kamogawensis]TRX69912.1 hypothetical protein EO216_17935 [Flammeovirga kamogawensis]
MKTRCKYDFVIVSPGRTGSSHLLESIGYYDDIIAESEVFNKGNPYDDSFNLFLKSKFKYKLLGFIFNRNIFSRNRFNFPLQYLIRKFFKKEIPLSTSKKRVFKIVFEQLEAYPYVLSYLLKQSVKFIYLDRINKFELMASMLKAKQDRIFQTFENQEQNRKQFFLCKEEVENYMKEFLSVESHFKSSIGTHNADIFETNYEALFGNYQEVVNQIRVFVGLKEKPLTKVSASKKVNPNPPSKWIKNFDEIEKFYLENYQ